jgi:hypothetical protein
LELGILRRRQVVLRLHDEVVRRHADLELGVFGVELSLRQPRATCAACTRSALLHADHGVCGVGRRLQFDLPGTGEAIPFS